jgi:putative ABC transport system permease protein
VLLFSLAITVATGLIFGLVPSWATTKTDLNESLKEGGLSTTAEPGRRRLRNALVVSEMALALVLLAGAGLLVRTFLRLVEVDLGIDPKNVVTMGLRLPDYKYESASQQSIFYQELLRRIGNAPGVLSAGLDGGGANVFFRPQGQPPAAPGQESTAAFKIITPDFLRAMGTGLAAGREFSARDADGAAPVALISETVAHRYWPHSSPIGSHLTVLARVYSGKSLGAAQHLEIVGVVKDVRNEDLWNPEAAVYVPFLQHPVSGVFLAVRTAVPPMSVMPVVREAVMALDKEQPINEVRTMSDILSQTYGAIRFPMTLVMDIRRAGSGSFSGGNLWSDVLYG